MKNDIYCLPERDVVIGEGTPASDLLLVLREVMSELEYWKRMAASYRERAGDNRFDPVFQRGR